MNAHAPEYLQALGGGVYAIDTGFHRPRFDAAYLLVQQGRGAFVDTGTNHGVPRLMASLQALGLSTDAIDWVIPTHVHLDHAGGVGLLMQQLPNARVLVHPRGVRHLVDPTLLWASATDVYGAEEMARAYGELRPLAAERVVASTDGMTVHLADRALHVIHTPGHARHHHCVWDALTHGWFTGDTFGLSYREFDTAQGAWILPSSTPVQFEPQALRESIQRLLARQPSCMYPTHFGRIDDVPRLGRLLLGLLAQMEALGRAQKDQPASHDALKRGMLDIYTTSLRAHGCTLADDRIMALLGMDLELNAQGMAAWLDRPRRKEH